MSDIVLDEDVRRALSRLAGMLSRRADRLDALVIIEAATDKIGSLQVTIEDLERDIRDMEGEATDGGYECPECHGICTCDEENDD